MRVRYKKNRMVQFYESECLTTVPREPPPVLTGHFERCADCPYADHGLPLRWHRRIPPGGGTQWHYPRLGQRDRALPHSGDQRALPRHDPRGGHHQAGWGKAAPGGCRLRGLALSGPERGWDQERSRRGPLRPVYGTSTHRKGDESGRCTTRTDRRVYSTEIPMLGKRPRRLQLGHAQGGGLPDRPRGDL